MRYDKDPGMDDVGSVEIKLYVGYFFCALSLFPSFLRPLSHCFVC